MIQMRQLFLIREANLDWAKIDIGRFERLHDDHLARREKLRDFMFNPDNSDEQVNLAHVASRMHMRAVSSYNMTLMILSHGQGSGKGNLKGALADVEEDEESVASAEKSLKDSGVDRVVGSWRVEDIS